MFILIFSSLLIIESFSGCIAVELRDNGYDTDKLRNAFMNLIKTNNSSLEKNAGQTLSNYGLPEVQDEHRTENLAEAAGTEQFKDELTKFISSKLAGMLRKHLSSLLFPGGLSNIEENTAKSSESSIGKSDAHFPDIQRQKIPKENGISNRPEATARQFVFHPYLPYTKDSLPDEKISIQDVLPVKMVKFIKGMVEDAPWEQMFQKMVRMVVDQFVDKIIDAMFAHKEREEKLRSLDASQTSMWSLPINAATSIVRLRRSANGKNNIDKDDSWVSGSFPSSNRLSKDDKHKAKDEPESESWLDSILDYLFPDDPKANMEDENHKIHQRRKRDSNLFQSAGSRPQMAEILQAFLAKYLELQTPQLAPENMNTIVRYSVRYKQLQSISQSKGNFSHPNTLPVSSENESGLSNDQTYVNNSSKHMTTPSVLNTRWSKLLAPESLPQPEATKVHKRAVRSTRDDRSQEKKRYAFDAFDKTKEEKRLWQSSRRSRPASPKMGDECSLRRACNAGRLLARLPSVQDVTLQLKDYDNEPHWNALLWGMSKKRCSRIFCKRQRFPKGSKNHWTLQEKRYHKKVPSTTRHPRLKYEDGDFTTIFSI